MASILPDQQLRKRLNEFPEIIASGFSVREGLTGTGVTILKARTYFGSWRVTGNMLVWVAATMGESNSIVETVEEAERRTLLLILRNLETTRAVITARALAS